MAKLFSLISLKILLHYLLQSSTAHEKFNFSVVLVPFATYFFSHRILDFFWVIRMLTYIEVIYSSLLYRTPLYKYNPIYLTLISWCPQYFAITKLMLKFLLMSPFSHVVESLSNMRLGFEYSVMCACLHLVRLSVVSFYLMFL